MFLMFSSIYSFVYTPFEFFMNEVRKSSGSTLALEGNVRHVKDHRSEVCFASTVDPVDAGIKFRLGLGNEHYNFGGENSV